MSSLDFDFVKYVKVVYVPESLFGTDGAPVMTFRVRCVLTGITKRTEYLLILCLCLLKIKREKK